MLSEGDVKEQLSYSYLHAVSAKAKLSCEPVLVDKDSIDAKIAAANFPEAKTNSPRLEVQLKATSSISIAPGDDKFSYPLKIKNYNDLRARRTVPVILVVLILPSNPTEWLEVDERKLIARTCAYWCSLLGLPESSNTSSVTVHVGTDNVLTPDALRNLMRKVANFETLS